MKKKSDTRELAVLNHKIDDEITKGVSLPTDSSPNSTHNQKQSNDMNSTLMSEEFLLSSPNNAAGKKTKASALDLSSDDDNANKPEESSKFSYQPLMF